MMINQWMEWMGYNGVAYFKTNPFLIYLLWVCKLTPMSWFRSQCFRGVFMHQLTTYLKCIRCVPWTPTAWAQHSYRPGWCLQRPHFVELTCDSKSEPSKKTCCSTHVSLAMSNHLIIFQIMPKSYVFSRTCACICSPICSPTSSRSVNNHVKS